MMPTLRAMFRILSVTCLLTQLLSCLFVCPSFCLLWSLHLLSISSLTLSSLYHLSVCHDLFISYQSVICIIFPSVMVCSSIHIASVVCISVYASIILTLCCLSGVNDPLFISSALLNTEVASRVGAVKAILQGLLKCQVRKLEPVASCYFFILNFLIFSPFLLYFLSPFLSFLIVLFLPKQTPRISESVVLTLNFLLNKPQTRKYIRSQLDFEASQ